MTKCLMCGTEFVPSKFNTTTQKYCSPNCRYKYWVKNHPDRIREIRKGWKKRNWRKTMDTNNAYARRKARSDWHTRTCKNKDCGKEFLPDLKHKNQQVYCSNYCQERWSHRWANITDYGRAKRRHDVGERTHRVRANGGKFTFQEWEQMKKDYNFICPICKRKEPEIKLVRDHIFPIVKGGKHCKENIQPLCISCNCKKHDKIDSVPCIRHTVIEKPTLKTQVVGESPRVVFPA